jgi:hypothetical protein
MHNFLQFVWTGHVDVNQSNEEDIILMTQLPYPGSTFKHWLLSFVLISPLKAAILSLAGFRLV